MRWKWLVIVALLFVALIQAKNAISSPDNADDTYGSIRTWMASADCARTEKLILVVCDGGKIRPIADVSAGDDPGLALFLGLYAAISGKAVTPPDIASLNAIVNTTGLVILAGLLLSLDLPLVAITLLALGPFIPGEFQWLNAHGAQFGATCLAMVAPLVILTMWQPPLRRSVSAWFAAGIVCLALASVFRQSIGLMGLVAGCIAVIALAIRTPRTPLRLTLYAATILLLVGAYQTPSLLLAIRDFAYGLPPSTRMETHGIWHNLFIGLGTVSNPWGLAWEDRSGLAYARMIDPAVQYTTNHYYDVLKGAYFDLVLHNPFTVLRIYLEKLSYAILRDKVWIALVVAAAPAWILRRRAGITESLGSIDSLLAVSTLFICFFLGQATLFHWSMAYRHPIFLPMITILGASFEMYAAEKRLKSQRGASISAGQAAPLNETA